MYRNKCILLEQLWPNIALEGSATQSSNHGQNFAVHAIDGNFTTDMVHLGSCAHTNEDVGAWWQVEFTDVYRIQKVAITTRRSATGKTLA